VKGEKLDLKTLASAIQEYLGDDGKVVSVSEIAEDVGFSPRAWTRVRLEMLLQGIPVCRVARGYRLGNPGEQASALLEEYRNAKALLTTISREIRAIGMSGQLPEAFQYTEAQLEESLRDVADLVTAAGNVLPAETMELLSAG
jgi:hypothetical protein